MAPSWVKGEVFMQVKVFESAIWWAHRWWGLVVLRRREQWPQHGSFHSHRAPPPRPFQVLMHLGEWGKLNEIEIRGIAGFHFHKSFPQDTGGHAPKNWGGECIMVDSRRGQGGHRSMVIRMRSIYIWGKLSQTRGPSTIKKAAKCGFDKLTKSKYTRWGQCMGITMHSMTERAGGS